MAAQLPRTGFLTTARSAPILGPGHGRPTSSRITRLALETNGPGKFYDDVDPRVYKATNGTLTPNLKTSGKRIDPKMYGAAQGTDKFYDAVPLTVYKERETTFRFDKAPRHVSRISNSKPGTPYYTMPSPNLYKEQLPRAPRWRPLPSRIQPPNKGCGADTFYDPVDVNVYKKIASSSSVPSLRGGGPRIFSHAHGSGADTFYDPPDMTIYKERSTAFRFGTAGLSAPPTHRVAPTRASAQEADSPKPAWVDRLAVHEPRPFRPWRRR